MKKNKNIIVRKVHDCYFMINIKDNYADEKCRLYEINEIGYYLWKAMDKCKSISELADELINELIDEIDRSKIINDVTDFVNSLEEMGFIEV